MTTILRRNDYLNFSQTTNFKLFQTESVCRRRFQIWFKKKMQKRVDNTVGKGEIGLYSAGWSFGVPNNQQQQKKFDPCQPARTAQADKGRNFLQMH